MTYANDVRTAGRSAAGLSDRIAGLFRAVAEARQKRAVYNRTLRELEQLSARDLADLGIARALIAEIAHEAAYGK